MRRLSLSFVPLVVTALVVSTTTWWIGSSDNRGKGSIAEVTVLVYSHGDNDLDGTLVGPGDLNEMVSQAKHVNFVVYHDRAVGNEPNDSLHLDLPLGYTGGYVFRVGSDGKAKEVQPLGEPYTMEPQTLAWFISYGLTNYPANTTILALDDHGGGPNAYFGSTDDDTPDDDPKAQLGPISLSEMTAALGSGIGSAVKAGWKGGTNGTRFDAIIHSSCLNGNYEIFRALQPYARYAFGSEEVTYGSPDMGSWDIDYSVKPPMPSSSNGSLEYLKSLVGSAGATYRAKAASTGNDQLRAIARAIFDLDEISTIDSAMQNFVHQLQRTGSYPLLLEARNGALGFGRGSGEPDPNLNLYDLGDLLARLPASTPREVLVSRDAVYYSLEQSRRFLDVDGPYVGARGLSVYFPGRGPAVNKTYQKLHDPTGWTRLIRDGNSSAPIAVDDVTLSVATTKDALKATLRSAKPLPTSAAGYFALGNRASPFQMKVSAQIPARLGAGGANQAQAAGTFTAFKFGDSPITARFSRDLTQLEFDALLVRGTTRKQSEVVVRQSSRYKYGLWTFGPPQVLQKENGSFAIVRVEADDLLAPLVTHLTTPGLSSDPASSVSKSLPPPNQVQIPELGVAGTSRLSAAPIAPGSELLVLASILPDNAASNDDAITRISLIVRP
jgi:hypothetical protein